MSTHTAGPWRTMFTGTGWTVNYNGPDHHWLVATINETPYIGNHAGNADLIAAAPDLLVALVALFPFAQSATLESHVPFDSAGGVGTAAVTRHDAINNARAAIAKAKGEA